MALTALKKMKSKNRVNEGTSIRDTAKLTGHAASYVQKVKGAMKELGLGKK